MIHRSSPRRFCSARWPSANHIAPSSGGALGIGLSPQARAFGSCLVLAKRSTLSSTVQGVAVYYVHYAFLEWKWFGRDSCINMAACIILYCFRAHERGRASSGHSRRDNIIKALYRLKESTKCSCLCYSGRLLFDKIIRLEEKIAGGNLSHADCCSNEVSWQRAQIFQRVELPNT